MPVVTTTRTLALWESRFRAGRMEIEAIKRCLVADLPPEERQLLQGVYAAREQELETIRAYLQGTKTGHSAR